MYHVIDSRFRNIKINSINSDFMFTSQLSRVIVEQLQFKDGSSPNKYTTEHDQIRKRSKLDQHRKRTKPLISLQYIVHNSILQKPCLITLRLFVLFVVLHKDRYSTRRNTKTSLGFLIPRLELQYKILVYLDSHGPIHSINDELTRCHNRMRHWGCCTTGTRLCCCRWPC